MLELRILNGYHRGATLPLDGEPQQIGASDDADVVLIDPGVEARHARLSLTQNGWMLEAQDGPVRDAHSNREAMQLMLQAGDFARIDQIWVTVAQQETAWQPVPPDPVDFSDDDDIDEASEDTANGVNNFDDGSDEMVYEGPLDDPEFTLDEEVPPEAPEGDVKKRPRKRTFLLVPVALLAVLSAAAAYAINSKHPAPEHKPMLLQGDPVLAPSVKKHSSGRKIMSQEELRIAFRQRLGEVDLLPKFNLDLNNYSWSMQAALDEEEAERFHRMLTEFVRANDIHFPVNAKIGSAESMLPFKIEQVISGADASIVTHDGKRLYVGDEYRGFRLAAIEGNQLSFTGKREINVVW